MSSPCSNCGADFKVCIECDFYNGKYIEKSVLDNIKAEIIELWGNEPCANDCGCLDEILEIIDKHTQ